MATLTRTTSESSHRTAALRKPPGFGGAKSHAARALLVVAAVFSQASGCAHFSRRGPDTNTLEARQIALRGMDALQRGQYKQAEPMLRHGVELCPHDERIRRQYAETLWALGDRDQAVTQMEQAVQLAGTDTEWAVRLGDMYLESGRLERASAQAESALLASREVPSAWALRGDVLLRQGAIDSSLASYHRALSFQPHYPRVQLAIADIYRQQKRYARELATLRTLADGYAADELPAQVLYLQGLALKKLRRYDAAIETLAAAESGIRPQSDVLYQLAEAQWLAGDPVNARLTVGRSLVLDPKHAGSQALHAQLVAAQPPALGTIRR